ncbi:MAG: hypothetical protein WCI36_02770 [bacterium]
MFGFKKSKTYCFHISNFDEIYENDIEFSQKIDDSGLPLNAFPAHLNTEKGVFCVCIYYKKDPLLENPDFSVEKMTKILQELGCNVTSVDEE